MAIWPEDRPNGREVASHLGLTLDHDPTPDATRPHAIASSATFVGRSTQIAAARRRLCRRRSRRDLGRLCQRPIRLGQDGAGRTLPRRRPRAGRRRGAFRQVLRAGVGGLQGARQPDRFAEPLPPPSQQDRGRGTDPQRRGRPGSYLPRAQAGGGHCRRTQKRRRRARRPGAPPPRVRSAPRAFGQAWRSQAAGPGDRRPPMGRSGQCGAASRPLAATRRSFALLDRLLSRRGRRRQPLPAQALGPDLGVSRPTRRPRRSSYRRGSQGTFARAAGRRRTKHRVACGYDCP